MIDWAPAAFWSVSVNPGPHPFAARATDGRVSVLIPYKTRREAVAMAPALARALAQANP